VLHSLTAYETNVWIRAEECPAGGQWREPNTSTYGVCWLDNDETMARSDAQVLLSKFCVASCRRCQQEAYAKSQPSHVALAISSPPDVAGENKVAGPMTESLASYSPWQGKSKTFDEPAAPHWAATTKMPRNSG